jgi:CxxC-x17-CxxC domain-containing protein
MTTNEFNLQRTHQVYRTRLKLDSEGIVFKSKLYVRRVCKLILHCSKTGVEKVLYNKEMHKATCADCGKECEVPFKPDGSRPVYCRECYAKRRPPRRY